MGRSGWRRVLTVALTIALVASQAPARLFAPIAAAAPAEAAAAGGFEGEFAGISGDLLLTPGQSGTFTTFFQNTGTVTWTRGTSTQVDLAVCVSGTCSVSSPQASWATGWHSGTAYATQSQTSVGPGQLAQFTWAVTVPTGTAPGEYVFEGELANGGQAFTQSGYAHLVRVPQGRTYTVRTAADDAVCDEVSCSLRGAITAANANPGGDTIVFDTGAGTTLTIGLTSELPAITESLVIDGLPSLGTPRVRVSGSAVTAGNRGFVVDAAGVTIRGLSITGMNVSGIFAFRGGGGRFVGNWIGLDTTGAAAGNAQGMQIRSANNVVGGTAVRDRNVISGNTGIGLFILNGPGTIVRGNRIGTNPSGTAAAANLQSGIYVQSSTGFAASGTVIGGTASGAGNLISGNGTAGGDHDGISLTGTGTGATIQGNRIGTNAAGTAAIPNVGRGIKIDSGATGIVIGGTAAGAGNLISGNGHDGIGVATNNNTIQGNFIGTGAGGSGALGNGNSGVGFYIPASGPASNNTVGGTAAGAGNVLANNAWGVFAFGGTGNAIRGNSIYNNHQLGIDLSPQGVNLNDAGDGDTGANDRQNFPVVTAIKTSGSNTTISWTLNSAGGASFGLDFFSNTACNEGPATFAYGEGQTFLGAVTATTDATGNASGTFTVPALAPNRVVTSTATDTNGNTSEFSACATVPRPRLAYVHNTDLSARDAWVSFLTARGYSVDAIAAASVEGTDFSRYNAILIGNDTGSGGRNAWGTAAAVSRVAGAGKRIIGLGDGGSQFFDTKAGGQSKIGWLQSWYSTGAGAIVVDGAHAAWTTPNNTGLATGATAGLYTASNQMLSVHAPAAATGVTRIGREIGDADHYPLISALCDTLWGFTASAATLTATGKDVFQNLLEPCALPDLVVTAVSAPATASPGATISYSWTVRNQGTATAVASQFSWTDQAWISPSQTSVAGAYPAGGIVAPSSLAPDASYQRSFSATLPSTIPPGSYFFIIQTDSNAQIDELSESNNLSAGSPITIAIVTYVVNAADDVVDGSGCNASHCSLREAIVAANASAGADRIHFAIPGAGAPVIQPAAPLPTITDPVVIDGTTQPGGWVVLNGAIAGTTSPGLRITGGGSTVRGLVVQRFALAGIALSVSGGSTIAGNRIGTTLDGLGLASNGSSGVVIDGSNDNVVGGTTAADRNLLSGNGVAGVAVVNGSTRNSILGNYIGLGADGRADVRNDRMGVLIEGPTNVVRGNVISGNNLSGSHLVPPQFDHGVVLRTATATNNVVAGNLIGPAADGTRGFPNAGAGVLITNGASSNTIGGGTPADRNVISGNSHNGIHIAGSTSGGNVIRGNYIGLAGDGQTALGNGGNGIALRPDDGGPQQAANTIQSNTIAGNNGQGIFIELAAGAHTISGNVIGLAADGLTARPNGNGLYVYLGETPQAAAMDIRDNTVSGNTVHGMYLYGVGGATVASNRIGLATDGAAVRGNGGDGIVLLKSSGLFVVNNHIHGQSTGVVLGAGNSDNDFMGNVVRGNGTTGFVLNGASNVRNAIIDGSISGHAGKGISLLGGANAGIVAPVVTAVSVGDGLSVAGTGAAGNTVAIYADPADEGLEFLGTAVVALDGTWQKSSLWDALDTRAIEAALRAGTRRITATQTDVSGNTSEFSAGRGLPAVARGTAEFRTVTKGVETALPLGGARVTVTGGPSPVAPVTADPTGAFTVTGLAANTDYTFTYAATLPTSFGTRLYESRAVGRTDGNGDLAVPRPPVYPDNKNHTWVSAARAQDGVVYAEQIRKAYGSIWYRFAIAPQQQIRISVTGLDAPYTLTAYRDLRALANALNAAASSLQGVQQVLTGGQSADGIDSDGIDSDGIDSDGIDSDGIDSDGIDSDGIDSDGIDSDGIDSDGIDSDGIDSDGIDSNGDGDTGFGPVYETVQDRGLRAASLNPGLADETIVLNTRGLSGDLYVRVRATETYDPFGTFNVQVTRVTEPSCLGADFAAVAPTTLATSLPTGKRTLILTNTAALGLGSTPTPKPAEATLALPLTATSTALTLVEPIPAGWGHVGWVTVGGEVMHFTGYDALTRTLAIDRRGDQGTTAAVHLTGAAVQRWTLTKSAYLALLGTLAARTEIAGHVLDLADDTGYASVHARWRALPACAALANVVTDTVNAVVSRFAAQNPLEYLVFAAGDHGIPYRRVADVAEIARESRYNPPVGPTTSSEASLIGDWILTDDFYGGQAVPRFERDLYLSKYAIGRLVERVEDQAAYIAMYTGTGGVLRPQSGISAGYDFNADAAREILKSLDGTTHGVTRLAMDQLITDATSATQWSAADLRALLFGAKKYDVLSLFGHYQANRLVPADNGPRVDSREIAVSTLAKFYRSLVFTIGCHSGYNIPDPDATIGTQPLAFPEAFLGQGATFVGGTGYQYGDTELVLYTELLLHMLSLELGYSNDRSGAAWGPDGVPIGAALRNAKALYASNIDPVLELTGLAEKSVLVSTLYGLPHLRFALPNPVSRPAPQPVATTPVNSVLSTYTTSFVNPALATPATGDTLFSLNSHAGVNGGTYYDGSTRFDVSAAPFRPISPSRDRDIQSTTAEIVRGSVFLGGTYVQSAFTPTLSVPVTEDAGPAPAYVTPNFLPVRPFSVNDLGGQRLIGLPFQYRSAGGASGTARVYSTVRTKVYYSGATGIAALVGAPEIRSVELTRPSASTNVLRLRVVVVAHGDPGNALITDPSQHLPGIAEVLATYTADSGPLHGTWASAPMTAGVTTRIGPDLFLREYTYDLDIQTADLGAAQFMVQAVGSYGDVEVASRNGAFYRFAAAATAPSTSPAATRLTLVASPAAVVYRQSVQLTATLRDAAGQAVAGKTVMLSLNGRERRVTTGLDGTAATTYVAALTPRAATYPISATFLGDATHATSSADGGVTVSRAPSAFVTTPLTLTYSSAGTIAQLRSGAVVLAEEPIVLTVGALEIGTTTDAAGRVRFETLDFGGVGPGTHAVGLRYAGGRSYDAAAPATVSVTVLPDEATIVLADMGPQPIGPITFSATVAEVVDAAPGDIRRATVEWTFTTESGVVTTATSPVAAGGTSTVTVTLAAGVYRVEARAGAFYTSDVAAILVPVYDASASVSGGGWVTTGADSHGVPLGVRGAFGFVAKYHPDGVTPMGNLELHVKSAKGKDNDTDAQAAANGSLKFKSTSYEWLVISGGGAAFTGRGNVNGAAGYSFRVDVVDGSPDVFVIHIWDANGSYSQPTHIVRGALGGGQIKIHR